MNEYPDQIIQSLQRRVSHPRLIEPGPSREQLQQLYQAAFRAPDHAWLRPWRFIEVSGDKRHALGQWMLESSLEEDPELDKKQQAKLQNAPLRAPMMLIAWTEVTKHPKVPAIEQILATGAAVTNLLNAAHAMGLGAVWRTGNPAYSHTFKTKLGLKPEDALVGFIYLGTPAGGDKAIPELNPQDYVTRL